MGQRSKNLPASSETIYISLDDLLIIHTDQIERYGGSHGIRDIGLLESALYRPQSSFAGEDLYPTLFEKTAVIVLSLLLNHAFIDGNKRTSIATMFVFLELNNFQINCPQQELIDLAIGIENKKTKKEDIINWLEKYSRTKI